MQTSAADDAPEGADSAGSPVCAEPSAQQLHRARRWMLKVRVCTYGSLLLIALMVLGARGGADASPPDARWVSGRALHGATIELSIAAHGFPIGYRHGAMTGTCDVARTRVPGYVHAPAQLVTRGPRLLARQSSTFTLPDGVHVDQRFRLVAVHVRGGWTGTIHFRNTWTRHGRLLGRCHADDTFRIEESGQS